MQKLFLTLIIVLLSIGALSAQSQPDSEIAPLYISGRINSSEDTLEYALYRYVNTEWEQLPLVDLNDGSLSPDGQWFAYRRTPPFVKALMDEGQGFLYGSAWDITLLNLQDNSERTIAVQPATITAKTDEGYEGGIKRSYPAWSPDSRALAWTELDYPARDVARLVVYDLESDETRILDEAVPLEALSVDGMPRRVSWGEPGIAVYSNDGNNNVAPAVRLYDPQTGLVQAVVLPFEESSAPLNGPLWVKDTFSEGNIDQVVIQAFQDPWQQIDPTTGEVITLTRQLEMISAINPAESLRLLWNVYGEGSEDDPVFQLVEPDGFVQLVLEEGTPVEVNRHTGLLLFGIASSGRAVAYVRDGVLLMWQDGEITEIAVPEGLRIEALHWGPTYWQTGSEPSRQTGDAMGG